MNGRIEIVKFLLENGVCVNSIDECGDTPLHLIVSNYKPKTEIIKILLTFGADFKNFHLKVMH